MILTRGDRKRGAAGRSGSRQDDSRLPLSSRLDRSTALSAIARAAQPGAADRRATALEGAVLTVRPVVDYEPPLRDVRQCRALSATALRRHKTQAPHQISGRQPASMSAPMRQAAIFADAALRRVLEVIDRRRPVAQLQGLLAAGLVDSVLAANWIAADNGAAAVLQRVRLQAAGRHERLTAAEVFGTYSRGRRIHAIACRIERAADRQWQVIALHIG